MKWLVALALMFLPVSLSAQAVPKLVPDVSQRQINIQSGFTGAELLLFGAIIYPRGVAPEGQIDVAVVLRGPARPITLREKQQIAGIWINADSSDFRSVPVYYAIASSRPLRDIVDSKTAAIYELGLDKLQLSPSGEVDAKEQRRFSNGLVDLKQRNGLFRQEAGSVEITDQVLYRARLEIPSSVPVGTYVAETLLIRNGRVIVADDKVEVRVRKTGFEQLVSILAQDYSLFYGTMAVLVSLLLGWFAGYIFQRF
ncbi:TIGR02186 family protein [Sphingorhabdus contaminans]|uniref:TIGR02186 family protein n=1 Tax=Sphingorhabdus contaminans TaxID=1343899 RepID=UPI003D287A55